MFDIIWDPIVATLAILLCSLAVYGFVAIIRRGAKPHPTPEKEKTYTGGEELKPEEIHAESGPFFSSVKRVLGPFYRYVQKAHTGELNTYLLWEIVGFVIILLAVLLIVGVGL